MRKLFIFLLFFHLYLFIGILNGYCKIRIKNVNITEAEQMIREKNYHTAKELLVQELENDARYEEYILKLIKKIDQVINEVNASLEMGMKAIREGNFIEAERIFSNIDPEGNYGTKMNEMVMRSQSLKEDAREKNDFNHLILEAEKKIVQYHLDEARQDYFKALSVYRIESPDQSHPLYALINRFNRIEKTIQALDLKENFDQSLSSLAHLNKNFIFLKNRMSQLQKIEQEIRLLSIQFKKQSQLVQLIEYQAYRSITHKFLTLVRRFIQRDFKIYASFIYQMTRDLLAEEGQAFPDELNQIYAFLQENNLADYSFYQMTINFNKQRLQVRSLNNIYEYGKDLLERIEILALIQTQKMEAGYQLSHNKFDGYLDNKDNGELLRAEELLGQAMTENRINIRRIDQYEKSNQPYQAYLETQSLKTAAQKQLAVIEKINQLNESLLREQVILAQINERIKYNLAEAGQYYKRAGSLYQKNDFNLAKAEYEKAKNRYNEVLADTKSNFVDKRLEQIKKRLAYIDEVVYQRDIRSADENIEKARSYLYEEEYERAKKEINIAKVIYLKYNIKDELLDNYDKRITTALKIRSGSQLIMGDPLYEKIVELYSNALSSFQAGNYKTAREFIDQILKEKPYYQAARQLETKILKIADPENFKRRFNSYFNQARTDFERKNYAAALQEFQQLLEFDTNAKAVRDYIYQSKVKLGLIKKVLTREDKNLALTLIARANQSYAQKDYQTALNLAEKALGLWNETPGATQIRQAARIRLRIPPPKLTAAEERLLAKAEIAYRDKNYAEAHKYTLQILDNAPGKGAQYDYVRSLNKKAYIKMNSS